MSVTFVTGDAFEAENQAIALGLNAAGRLGVSALHTRLLDRYPVFASSFHRQGRAGQLVPGAYFIWRESDPWLVALIVRETLQGAIRPRFVEAALLSLARDWQREGLRQLALDQFTDASDAAEWPTLREIIHHYLKPLDLPVTVYESA